MSSDSFSAVLTRLRADDSSAAELVFARYAGRLVAVARGRLSVALSAKEDPDDVVQSVFRSFFTRLRGGEFALADWDSLWGVLVVITLRKCGNRLAYYRAARRDVGREVEGAGFTPADRNPTPDEAAALAETVERVLAGLGPRDRNILTLHLLGHDPSAIAAGVGRSLRTVRRVLDRARRDLVREVEGYP
jgi:RNA polymerase sigma-70 factor (ECF subfamily)